MNEKYERMIDEAYARGYQVGLSEGIQRGEFKLFEFVLAMEKVAEFLEKKLDDAKNHE